MIVLALALIAGPATLSAQDTALAARLQHALDSIVMAQHLPGATAAVSIDGRVLAVASGFADRERHRRMTNASRMLLGSATKPMFAYVVLSAVAKGKLELDAPVARWLGNVPWFARLPNAPQLTMRHLLAHRGGVANHAGDSTFAAMVRGASVAKRQQGFTPEEQIELVLDRPAPFAAGGGFLYSDTGYLIAAMALERALGRRYYSELVRRVLKPLGLRHTSPSTRSDLEGLAQGYPALPGELAATQGFATWGLPELMVRNGRLALNPVYEWTGGGLVSTSSDLARWLETLFEVAPWKRVGEAMVAARAVDAPYGFGIFVQQTPVGLLYSHPGGFPGYATFVAYAPEQGIGIAFQANRNGANGGAAVQALLLTVGAATR